MDIFHWIAIVIIFLLLARIGKLDGAGKTLIKGLDAKNARIEKMKTEIDYADREVIKLKAEYDIIRELLERPDPDEAPAPLDFTSEVEDEEGYKVPAHLRGEIDYAELKKDLDLLRQPTIGGYSHGLLNTCYGDGYFSKSLVDKYNRPILELERLLRDHEKEVQPKSHERIIRFRGGENGESQETDDTEEGD